MEIETAITSRCLSAKKLEALKQIIQQDYEVVLSDEEADQLGFSLLRITRLAISVFNREEDRRSVAST